MKYRISREELVEMIEAELNVVVKKILINHLRAMDGEPTECSSCVLKDEAEAVQELVEVVEEEVSEDGE